MASIRQMPRYPKSKSKSWDWDGLKLTDASQKYHKEEQLDPAPTWSASHGNHDCKKFSVIAANVENHDQSQKTLKGRKLQFRHDGGQTNLLFFHFQCTGSEISDARREALLLDLHQQRTTKATGNAWRLLLQTLSLALALAQRLQCEHLFFLLWQFFQIRNISRYVTLIPRLMGTRNIDNVFQTGKYWSPSWQFFQFQKISSYDPFAADTRLPNWDLNQLPNKKYQMTRNTRIRA